MQNLKIKSSICFIDFSKAYDKISRPLLFQLLVKLGCGNTMLNALQAIYKTTKNVLNSAIILSKVGIKQGGSSSGLLFVQYMDVLAKMLKKACPQDDYLKSLHSLMLMDDTALLGTSRKVMLSRYDALVDFCEKYDMTINWEKTKFMVINGTKQDKLSFEKGGLTIQHTDSYVYLGSPVSVTGNVSVDIKEHASMQSKHINKYRIYCQKNQSMPYSFKKKVFDAMLTSKLVYGSEAWLIENLKPIETLYIDGAKALLGVRKTTPNEIVLAECGLPDIMDITDKRLRKFIGKKLIDPEEPLTIVYNICRDRNTKGFRILKKKSQPSSYDSIENRKANLRSKTGTKYETYRMINPSLSVIDLYSSKNNYIPDYKRVEMTRMRTGSHRLKVETGRWSRTPHHNRVCVCDQGAVQDEYHVLFQCPITEEVRRKHAIDSNSTIDAILKDEKNVDFVAEIMKIFN